MKSVSSEHEEYQLPDHDDVPAYQSPNIPDYNSVKTRFQQTGKKRQALLGFLSDSYPDLEADEMLFLYQKLINESDLALSQEQQKSKITIASHTFSLYPFSAKAKQD